MSATSPSTSSWTTSSSSISPSSPITATRSHRPRDPLSVPSRCAQSVAPNAVDLFVASMQSLGVERCRSRFVIGLKSAIILPCPFSPPSVDPACSRRRVRPAVVDQARPGEARRRPADLPGTGGEFARHLLDEAKLDDVKVELTDKGDHYDPEDRAVRLLPQHHDGRSVSAVAVAAHEVSHAIQHARGEPAFMRRIELVRQLDLGPATCDGRPSAFALDWSYW